MSKRVKQEPRPQGIQRQLSFSETLLFEAHPGAHCYRVLTHRLFSFQDLQLYLSNLANQIDRETGIGDVPLVILLDDLSEAGSISELVNGALTCKYHKW